jgi:hypothetical protein
MGRQARALAVREISESYFAPLGVWVVREAARNAMRSGPKSFGALGDAIKEMELRIKTPSQDWRPHSRTISSPRQSSLSDFIGPELTKKSISHLLHILNDGQKARGEIFLFDFGRRDPDTSRSRIGRYYPTPGGQKRPGVVQKRPCTWSGCSETTFQGSSRSWSKTLWAQRRCRQSGDPFVYGFSYSFNPAESEPIFREFGI